MSKAQMDINVDGVLNKVSAALLTKLNAEAEVYGYTQEPSWIAATTLRQKITYLAVKEVMREFI